MSRARGLLLFGLLAVAVVTVLEWQRRQDLYWYDTGRDYRYRFAGDSAATFPVELRADGFVVPEPGMAWETAVLALEVEADWAGRWFEPALELDSGDWRSTWFLDRGAMGFRYLVLHASEVAPGAQIRVTGRHLAWPAQEAALTFFPAAVGEADRVLVIAPHPDDAEIAAFGLYSSHDSFVATVTAGNYVDGRYAGLRPDRTEQDVLRGRVRAWDSLVVPTWGGVAPGRIVNLGYWNGSLERLHAGGLPSGAGPVGPAPDPERYRAGAIRELLGGRRAEPTWSSLVEDLRRLLGSVRPDVIVAPHPLLDAAPDHQYTTLALLEALSLAGDASTTLLLYTNHHVLSEYYPFGSSGTAVPLPPWFDEQPVFGAVYSFPLDKDLQEAKLFALEAMHDLRGAPMLLEGGPSERFFHLARAALGELLRNPLGTYSYFRRAIRSNELFFVYRPGDRAALADAIESGLGVPPDPGGPGYVQSASRARPGEKLEALAASQNRW